MKETMKKYIKPATEAISFQMNGMMAQSLTMGEKGKNTTDTDLTRGKQGFGKGMWEDMK